METITHPTLECGVAARALDVRSGSGDRHVICPFPGGVLVGALDGLGHGREASDAALLAASILQEHAQEPVASLFQRCHDRLRFGRGVVMSLASFRRAEETMTWMGVGNVQGLLLRAPDRGDLSEASLAPRAGVLGIQLPEFAAETLPVVRGDTLILVTDGIRGDFSQGVGRLLAPQLIADIILGRCRKGIDDALVLVARFSGGSP
jgi:phosphoserine phosphatase RsbX